MIKYDLKNRVAIVTGGAQGFGLAITKRFIESGAKVVIWDIDEGEAKKALEKVNSENLTYQIVDVSNYEAINSKLSEVEKSHGKIDIFINNAGVAGMNTTVEEYPIDEWNKVINLNLNVNYRIIRSFEPLLKISESADVVFISDSKNKKLNPYWGAYNISKLGLEALVKTWEKEINLTNIKVHIFNPLDMDTHLRSSFMPGERNKNLKNPDEMANLLTNLIRKN